MAAARKPASQANIDDLTEVVGDLADRIEEEKEARHVGTRNTRIAIAVLLVLVLAVAALGVNQRVSNHTQHRREAKDTLDTNYLNCLRGNELRSLMRTMTLVAFSGQGPLDLTGFPAFPKLDTATQEWVREIAAATAQPSTQPSTRDRVLADIQAQVRDCGTEWAGHTPGLALHHTRHGETPVTQR